MLLVKLMKGIMRVLCLVQLQMEAAADPTPDVVLKGTMPVSETIGIFAKAGVATTIYIPGLNSCQEGTAAKFYPTVSTGGSFGLSEGLFFDISWNRLGVRGDLSYIDLYALGFSYHF